VTPVERLVYLIRHGATDWNHAGRIQGHLDPPLNAAGRAQARLVGRRLAAFGATALYSSDLLRTCQTASIIGEETGLRVIQKTGLREMHFGSWQGLTSPQIRQRDPQGYAARKADPYHVAPAGGETWQRFYDRCVRALHEVLTASAAEKIIVVAHGGVLTALGLRALGFDYRARRTFGIDNCSIHTIAISGEHWRAVALNDVAHLHAETPSAAS
jgi:probable phosphoglycerate mutase